MYFTLSPAQLKETVWADKGVGSGKTPIALWTDNELITSPTTNVILTAGTEIEQGEHYQILITYDESEAGNKKGLAEYYLYQGATWQKIDDSYADFSSLSSTSISLEGENTSISCSSGIVQPPTYSDDAQYEFGIAACSGGSCAITFDKAYEYIPLVFVMPTISTTTPDDEEPATLVVNSVSRTSAQIEQISDSRYNYPNNTPMTEVSYLVIEPGVASFGGHEVIAGYLETSRYKSKNGNNGTADQVLFSEFGKSSDFNADPVVLHQLQTRNNGSKWLTSGKTKTNQDRNSASLFLEASASISTPYDAERIGFIATTGASNLSVGDYKVEFARGTDTTSQSHPNSMANVCENSWVSTQLAQVDGIITNKQERAGGHGGWLRRCEITEDANVSFVVDEDYSNRGHIPEEMGYFAFEIIEPEIPDVCPYFPAVAQSWSGSLKSHFNFPSGSAGKVTGTVNLLGEVGFNSVSKGWSTQLACDGKECSANSELILLSPPPILDIDITGGDLTLGNNSSSEEVPGNNFNKLTIDNAGQYTMSETVYNIGELVIGGSAVVTFPNSTLLKVNKITVSNNAIIIVDGAPLTIWAENGENETALIDLQDSGPDLEAYLFSRDAIKISGNMKVLGAATADELLINGSAHLEYKDLGCGIPPINDYRLELTPTSDIALTCEVIPLEATVYRDNVPDTSFTGSVTLYDSNGQSINSENASGGVAKFDLSTEVPNQSQTRSGLYAQTQIGDVTYRSASSGDYKFVPFRFEVKDQYVIAGKDTSVTASVLACDDGSSTPDLGYVGSPDMSYAINIPTSGAVGDLTYAPEFDSGESTADLIFRDAGQLTVTLVDENYNCTVSVFKSTHSILLINVVTFNFYR